MMEGDRIGRVMAGMVKEAVLKRSGGDVGLRRAAVEGPPYEGAARRLGAITMSDEKKAAVSRESRGECGICGEEVIAGIGGDRSKGHERLRYSREEGHGNVHFHMECVADLCDRREKALSSKGICGICRQIVRETEDRVPLRALGFVGGEVYVHRNCAKQLLFKMVGVDGKG